MYSLVIVAVASFVAALLLTPFSRDLAIRLKLLDQPDHHRKTHTHAVPRIGGIAIFIAYFATLAVALLLPIHSVYLVHSQMDLVWKLFPAAAVVFATGLIDDIFGLKPWQKLLGQVSGAILAFSAGVHLDGISGHYLGAWWTLPATVGWLIICTNAFNLIDGVDGLAVGVGLFATITTLIAALFQPNIPLAVAAIPLAGALLGFLCYNFNPASVYLGDSGSLLIGFLLGCYSILWTGKAATIVGMTAPLMMLAVPLVDTALAVIRRYLRNQPIFGADRGHIHHRLLARGFTPRRVVVVLYGMCGLCGFLSLMQSVYHQRVGGAIIILFCAGVWFGVQHLGYTEFDAARRIVFGGAFRRLLNAELQLIAIREALAVAVTPDECWRVLERSYGDFGFSEIRLRLRGCTYTHTITGRRLQKPWTIRIALSEHDYLNLSREVDAEVPPVIAAFPDTIAALLRARTSEMQSPAPMGAYQVVGPVDSRPALGADYRTAQAGSSR